VQKRFIINALRGSKCQKLASLMGVHDEEGAKVAAGLPIARRFKGHWIAIRCESAS
jgi:hypothetical protein